MGTLREESIQRSFRYHSDITENILRENVKNTHFTCGAHPGPQKCLFNSNRSSLQYFWVRHPIFDIFTQHNATIVTLDLAEEEKTGFFSPDCFSEQNSLFLNRLLLVPSICINVKRDSDLELIRKNKKINFQFNSIGIQNLFKNSRSLKKS